MASRTELRVEVLLSLAVVAAMGGLGVWRWKAVVTKTLTDDECEAIATQTVGDLFSFTQAPEDPVKVDPSYWNDLQGHQAIEVSRWMIGRGYVTAENWGLLDILTGSPPRALALTQKSYHLQLAARSGAGHAFIGNENVNVGGVQIVAGDSVDISGAALADLARAVRADAALLDSLNRAHAVSAAEILEQAAKGKVAADSPQVSGTIAWLKERAGEAVGGAMGSALWAATSAVLRQLFS